MANSLAVKFIFSSLLIIGIVGEDHRPETKIKNGLLRGVYLKSRNAKFFSAYLGVPYAQPPIGELRFKNPVPVQSWSGTYEANNDSKFCIQRNDVIPLPVPILGEEDCLYLNVYTPKIKSSDSKKYPVMVWIHGGAWVFGAGTSDMYSPNYLLDHDVVLVSPNYRLGPLGFLSTEDESSPGNYGLKDQQLALKWVQKNIEHFGGDPNSVTIFGESAGGASVEYHMFSKGSRGLFHRAITQSGTVFNNWAQKYLDSAKDTAIKYGEVMNCPTSTTVELVSCLRNKDVNDLIEKTNFSCIFDIDPMISFRPVVEPESKGAFLTENPIDLIEKGDVSDVPKMAGFTSNEGVFRTATILSKKSVLNELDKNRYKLFPITFIYHNLKNQQDQVTDKIVKKYFGDKPIDNTSAKELTDVYSDSLMVHGMEVSKRLHQFYLKSPLYLYYFGYRGKHSYGDVLGKSDIDLGVSHCDDLIYIFPLPILFFPNSNLTPTDQKMVDIMTKLWTNFAKYGTPIPKDQSDLGFEWTPNTQTIESESLHILSPMNIKMGKNPVQERVDFWINIPFNVILSERLKKANLLNEQAKDEL